VSGSTIIDDLSNRRDLATLLEWAQDGPIPVERLRWLAYGAASSTHVAAHGDHWLRTLIDVAERAGIGTLERDPTGRLVLVPGDRRPSSPAAAWEAVTRSWGPPLRVG
jgi:hypothetical protein